MKKYCAMLLMSLAVAFMAKGQDTIITTSHETMVVKIIEITNRGIIYTLWQQPDGEQYTILQSAVKEVRMNNQRTGRLSGVAVDIDAPGTLRRTSIGSTGLMMDGEYLSAAAARQILGDYQYLQYKEYNDRYNGALLTLFAGTPVLGLVGGTLWAIGAANDLTPLSVIGVSCVAGAAACLIYGIVGMSVNDNKMDQVVKRYNSNNIALNIGITGLTLEF